MIDRRRFLCAGSAATLVSALNEWGRLAPGAPPQVEAFEWSTKDLTFSFAVIEGQVRQKRLVPLRSPAPSDLSGSSGVEVALQCSGEDSPDQGLKSGVGQPGARLKFVEKREEITKTGQRFHSDPDKACFNLVTAMMGRIHQSGRLDKLSRSAFDQVRDGIGLYKRVLRPHIPKAIPFYPLGKPDVTNSESPIALGMRAPELSWMAVWRLDGASTVRIHLHQESLGFSSQRNLESP